MSERIPMGMVRAHDDPVEQATAVLWLYQQVSGRPATADLVVMLLTEGGADTGEQTVAKVMQALAGRTP